MTGSLDLSHAPTRSAHDALSPYLQQSLERAAEHAWRLHADEITLEHLFTVILVDEDSAAHRAIVFGFADPPTLAAEALALSPGILVVGSGTSLPFSPRGVATLFDARERAAAEGSAKVTPAHLFAAAYGELEDDARAALEVAGFDATGLAEPPEEGEPGVEATGALFASFSDVARRSMGLSCRLAARGGSDAIAPAHIARAALETVPDLAQRAGIGPHELGRAVTGNELDPTTPEPRAVAVDADLARFLESLPSGGGTLQLLGAFCERGPGELIDILKRNRIGQDLVERASGSYRDPA